MAIRKAHWAFIHPFQLRLQRGIEVYLWNLAATLARQEVFVDILTWDGPLEIPDYAQNPYLRVRRVPSVRYYQSWFGVPYYVSWLLQDEYQHVFVDFAGYGEGLALQLAQRLRGIPFSVVFHFPPSQVPHRYREFMRWGFSKNATRLIGVSQATATEVQNWAKRTCVVIGHGVNAKRFRPDAAMRAQARASLGFTPNAPILITVAALEERKGIQWVLRAMPEVLKTLPGLHYIVIGDGPYRDELRSLAMQLGVEGNVRFLGAQLDVHPYLCAADLMMVLARGEASSISLLEGLACGLPAITSRNSPFDELIREPWGIQVDETNSQQVSSVILSLLRDSGKRASMGAAGRSQILEHHSWNQVAKQYLELLQCHYPIEQNTHGLQA